MSEYKPYKPTDDEIEQADKAALMAAFEALKPIMDDDLSPKQEVTIFLRAFDAANKAYKAYGRALLAKNPGFTDSGLYGDSGPVVCSAFYAIENDCIDLMNPHSVAGHRLCALVNASKAMAALSEFEAVISDGELLSYNANDALKLASSSK